MRDMRDMLENDVSGQRTHAVSCTAAAVTSRVIASFHIFLGLDR